jgi:hypothetical protein
MLVTDDQRQEVECDEPEAHSEFGQVTEAAREYWEIDYG